MILGLVLCLGMWNGEVRAGTNTNVTVNSYIEDSIYDGSNVYYFQLSSLGKVQVELKHDINAWYDVYIDEVNNEGVINNWDKYRIESEATTIDGTITQHSGAARLPVGKYRVRIANRRDGYGREYKLKINYEAEGEGYEKEPNDTAQYATDYSNIYYLDSGVYYISCYFGGLIYILILIRTIPLPHNTQSYTYLFKVFH